MKRNEMMSLVEKYGIQIHEGTKLMATQNNSTMSKADFRAVGDHKVEIMSLIKEMNEEKKVAEEKAAAEKAAKIEAIKAGKIKIEAIYHDGEVLSGLEVIDREMIKVLEGAGIGRYVDGWGYHVTEDDLNRANAGRVEDVVAAPEAVESIPLEAIAAYNRYNGSADKAWENEDEQACMIIRAWEDKIVAARGLHRNEAASLQKRMAEEAAYGITE